ncbi:unnamed protein product, partial [Hapterophycus canaliculatus]
RELQVDVVVVGSGAGGGCAAGALAARGLRVAVLEKGGRYGVEDFAGFSEMEAYKKMYESQVRARLAFAPIRCFRFRTVDRSSCV